MMQANEEKLEATSADGAPIGGGDADSCQKEQFNHKMQRTENDSNNINLEDAGVDSNGLGNTGMEGGQSLWTNDMPSTSFVHCDNALVANGILKVNNAYPTAADPYYVPRYSPKVFIGGLPPDIDPAVIYENFKIFGSLRLDWPRKLYISPSQPMGFLFLIFDDERNVHKLLNACLISGGKYFSFVSSPTIKNKLIEVRPWVLSDSYYVFAPDTPHDPRNTIFLGGTPRTLKASELAIMFYQLFGRVYSVSIDTCMQYKYPKGSAVVSFVHRQSYIDALATRYIQLTTEDMEKRVEMRAYILTNQTCEHCMCFNWPPNAAPYFCANASCLQYFCMNCWATIHSQSGCNYHKPLVKGSANPPRGIPYQWC